MFQLVCGLGGAVVSIAGLSINTHNRSNLEKTLAVKLDKLSDFFVDCSLINTARF